MTILEIHCPECGEFKAPRPAMRGKTGCPRCGNRQAIIMEVRRDITDRFDWEKRSASISLGGRDY